MNDCKISLLIGNYIFHYGIPYAVITYLPPTDKQENEINEIFTFIKRPDERVFRYAETISSPPGLIEDFFQKEGVERAKKNIEYKLMFKISEEENISFYDRSINILEYRDSFITYLNSVDNKEFDWIKERTNCEKLKELISISKKFKIIITPLD